MTVRRTVLSSEDRLIIRFLRKHPSTIQEIEDIFQLTAIQPRLRKLERAKLIFSLKMRVPKYRIKATVNNNDFTRLVYFAMPNKDVDVLPNTEVNKLIASVKMMADKLSDDNEIEDNYWLLVQLDSVTATLYTRYVHESQYKRKMEESPE